jgi:hypothetical protein
VPMEQHVTQMCFSVMRLLLKSPHCTLQLVLPVESTAEEWFDENYDPFTSDSDSDIITLNYSCFSEKLADWVNEFGIKHNAC